MLTADMLLAKEYQGNYWLAAPDTESPLEVLELGCGSGLAGIAAAKAGAVVTATDAVEDATKMSRQSAIINAVADRMQFSVANW
eukprot:SAG31_NODE_17126_length_682_cov_1.048027_1_plen_83_part_10